jgi:hypothetical protein
MQTASDYRADAEVCVRLARDVASAEQRAFLMELAATWTRLAEQREELDKDDADGAFEKSPNWCR